MRKNIKNLILGGAQISSVKYGITNNSFIRKDELTKIINFEIEEKKIQISMARAWGRAGPTARPTRIVRPQPWPIGGGPFVFDNSF